MLVSPMATIADGTTSKIAHNIVTSLQGSVTQNCLFVTAIHGCKSNLINL